MKALHYIFAAMLTLSAAGVVAQQVQLPAPSPIEKELAAKASDVTEVTLGKDMLTFAAGFMNGKDQDEAAAREMVKGLQGIYVRTYTFEKDGAYSPEQLESLRKYFTMAGEWTPMVHTREAKSREVTDVMMKMINGESQGIFVLSAEPRELTIVLILGPIRMQDLGKLKGMAGLSGALGDSARHASHGKGGEE